MDIRQIRTFVYVSELRNFTRASAFLHVSQPALSRQIRLLEEEVGAKLFHRMGHGVELTEQGKALLDRCVLFLNQFASLRDDFKANGRQGEGVGKVRLGLPVPATRFVGEQFLARLKRQHPGISLEMAEGFNPLIHEWLLSGSIDIAILYGSFSSSVLKPDRLAIEDLFAIGPPSSKNLKRTTMTTAELRDQTLILPNRPHILRTLVESMGVSEGSIIEANPITLMFEMVRAGHGYAILPGNSLNPAIASRDIVALKIVEPNLSWEVSIWHSALQELSEPVQIVREMLRDEVLRQISEGGWSARVVTEATPSGRP